MALSAIALCSRALLKIGASGLSSFDDGTVESEVAVNLYPGVRDALLSAHPWSFATAQTSLARLNVEPMADFDYAYQLPQDFLRALSVGEGGRGRGVNYRLQERRLHTNSPSVVLSYIFRPDPESFPPFFDQVLIGHLAAEFCLPVTESSSRAEALLRQAEKDLRQARNIDSQQQTSIALEATTLIDVRR